MNRKELLINGFLKPQDDHRPVTMWFVGDKLDKQEITTQLETFRAKVSTKCSGIRLPAFWMIT